MLTGVARRNWAARSSQWKSGRLRIISSTRSPTATRSTQQTLRRPARRGRGRRTAVQTCHDRRRCGRAASGSRGAPPPVPESVAAPSRRRRARLTSSIVDRLIDPSVACDADTRPERANDLTSGDVPTSTREQTASRAQRSDRRRDPHTARQAQRQAQGLASGRPRRRDAQRRLIDRNDIDPAIVDDVVMGCVMQVGEQAVNVARNAVLAAGWPETVPGTTIDRQCGSSQQAAHFAAQGVIAGAYDVVVAAGVEVMTRVPMGASMVDGKFGFPFGPTVERPVRRAGRARAAGHLGRADRRQVGHHPRGDRRLRPALAAARARGRRRGPLRARDPAGARRRRQVDAERRGSARDDARVAGQAQAGVPVRGGRRPGHRRQLVADHRRRLGGADHERGAGRRARADAAGALRDFALPAAIRG